MYSKLLVPLDESPCSESVVPLAANLASALGLPMELLHVLETDVVTLKRLAGMKQEQSVEANLTATGEAYLQRVVQRIPNAVPVSCRVEIGHAAETIIDEAGKDQRTLVAMSTRGLTGAKKWFFGSVADKVLQASTNPLLLIKPAEEETASEFSIKRILVPLDGSPTAEIALPHAITIAKALKLKIELLRVYQMPIGVAAPTPYMPRANMITAEALLDQAKVYLHDKASQASSAGVEKVSYVVAQGNAGEQIIDTAEQGLQALVVMSSHGRSGVGRWLLGSVAARVANHASQPVLIVRAAPTD